MNYVFRTSLNAVREHTLQCKGDMTCAYSDWSDAWRWQGWHWRVLGQFLSGGPNALARRAPIPIYPRLHCPSGRPHWSRV